MQLITRLDRPDLWAGPSVLLSTSDEAGRCAVAATGYRRHLSEWEERWTGTHRCDLAGLAADIEGDADLFTTSPDGNARVVEVDVVADTSEERALVLPLLRSVVPAVVLDGLDELGPVGSMSASANKDLPRSDAWQEHDIAAVDLIFNTLPSRRGKADLPLISAHRYVRLIGWPTGMLALWEPAAGRWSQDALRWPHHGVPSRSMEWYRHAAAQPMSASERLAAWLADAVKHEHYFLDTWTLELAASEQEIFTQLADGQATFAGLQLGRLQADLGVLAKHLDGVSRTQRTLRRRAEESALIRSHPQLTRTAKDSAAHLEECLAAGRQNLRESFALLASAAQGAQAYAAAESQKQSERLNVMVTVVTALLLVPSLVAGIYGANLRELSPGTNGSITHLAILMAVPALLTAGALQLLRASERPSARSWASLSIALGLGLGGAYAASRAWSPEAGGLIGAVAAVTGVVAAVSLRRRSESRGEASAA